MSNKTSIILCTYNEAKHIELTISELEKYIPNLEIVIVDDCSSDGTVEILKKLLTNSEVLESYATKLNSKVCNLYEDKKNFQPIYEYIENLHVKKVQLIQMPYWYIRICAKMIILRNANSKSRNAEKHRSENCVTHSSSFLDCFKIILKEK